MGNAGRARAAGVVLGGALMLWAVGARGEVPYEGEPINYLTAPADDPVARLQEKIDRGEARLEFDAKHGYLKSLLEHLGVPASSQALVFSKTSFQSDRIFPRAPRAIYYGDDVYVGFVRGGDVLEVAAVDPELGATFYLLTQEEEERPEFLRQTHACLQCHASGKTQDVPGLLVRSVYPDRTGMPVFNAGSFVTGHESPLSERWGGWYVTGTHGAQRHLGNVVVTDRAHPEQLDTDAGANVTELGLRVDSSRYLEPGSDLVALMVMEHQTQMHNRITAAHYAARLALHYQEGINKALNRPADYLSDSTRRRIESASEKLLEYLLFSGEAMLSEPVAGTSSFTREFAARGPRDSQGRSLRDFDLTRRLFRYPCSYLIYSEAFDALPAPVKGYLGRRLGEVLGGKDNRPAFAHLSDDDRRVIREILQATKPGMIVEGEGP